jgi:purine-binding chemotaxis protein CheW
MSKFSFRKKQQKQTTSKIVETHKFLSFRLGDENFGFPILNIKEIIEYGGLTAIPMMPDFIRGAINLRSHIVPIMDLAVRLGRKTNDVSRRTCIVIVELMINGVRMDVGIMVDAVNEVIDIDPSAIDPAPTFGGNLRAEFLLGMGKVGDRFLILLNVDKIITLDDAKALQSAGSRFVIDAAKTTGANGDTKNASGNSSALNAV